MIMNNFKTILKHLSVKMSLTLLGWLAQSGQALRPFKGSERLLEEYSEADSH